MVFERLVPGWSQGGSEASIWAFRPRFVQLAAETRASGVGFALDDQTPDPARAGESPVMVSLGM